MEMKTYKTNSQISIRDNLLDKLNKKENSILSNKSRKSNLINLSFSKITDEYHKKLGNVKNKLEKKYEVIIFKFRTMKKIGKNYNLGLLIGVN